MIRFSSDYTEGASPEILQALTQMNLQAQPGYGCDEHCAAAADAIRQAVARPDADVHFLMGGTQTNATALCAFLRPHEAAIAAHSGHICVHETGAIEATGHKCIAMPAVDGKLTPEAVRAACAQHPDEHMVKPRLVYISQSTEIGTLYSLAELEALRAVCDELGLLLYLDGARLGVSLDAGDATLADLGRLCDAFYFGGTKNGALFGEALIILDPALKPDFRYILKQHGGMLAKGWLLGVQFEQLMQNDLYLRNAHHANQLGYKLRDGLAAMGIEFACDSPTNQQFPLLPAAVVDALCKNFVFDVMEPTGDGRVRVRLVTSWATPEENVDALLSAVKAAL